jgi:hypothetical protein
MELPPHAQVLQMMMGYWVSQVLATVAELGIADHLTGPARTSDELADLVKTDKDATLRLLRAAAGVGLLEKSADQRYSLTPMGACLRGDSPTALRDFVVAELSPGHWQPWGRLSDAIRTGKPQMEAAHGTDVWTYYAKHPVEAAWFARGMGNLSKIAAAEIAPAYDFSSFGTICDVGGSQGALLASVLRAAPKSRGILFDRPEVITEAAAQVKSYALGDRLSTQPGDFFETMPVADAYLLKSILHDWNDERSIAILKSVAKACKPGSKVLLVEVLLGDTPMASPINLMDLNMLVLLGGRERTAEQFGVLLKAAGFQPGSVTPTFGLFSVIEGVRT